jgi:hypothetical protein
VKISPKLPDGYILKKGDIVVVHMPRPFPLSLCPSSRIATEAEVVSVSSEDDESLAEIKGIRRVVISMRNEIGEAYYADLPEPRVRKDDDATERLRRKAREFVFLVNVSESDRLIYLMGFMNGISEISDFVSHYFIVNRVKSGKLYRTTDPYRRGTLLEKYISDTITRLNRSAEDKS